MRAGFYRNYLLTVLMVILAFNYVDRNALGLLLQDIKVDLDLSDTQLGFLTGIAFALFYSVLGVPIARWADRGNRVTIVTLTTGLWSAAVALCGMAGNFTHLLLIRIGVAVGEAGCVPPAHSLIADYFSRAERPRATAIYMLGVPLSAVIGYFLAGWLNARFGWRMTFVLLGLPGIALALLVALTFKEPRRTEQADAAPAPAFKDVCRTLWSIVTFRHLLMCFAVVYFFGYGIQQWKPAFFIRSFSLSTAEVGAWLAAIYGGGSLLGTYYGGVWATRFAANREDVQLKAIGLAYAAFAIVSIGIYIVPNAYAAFALMAVATVGVTAVLGPLFGTIQTLVPAHMRATSISLIYLFANLIGMGLGPIAAGVLSDTLQPRFGDESLRYALLALSPGFLWAAWHAWRGARSVMADLKNSNINNLED